MKNIKRVLFITLAFALATVLALGSTFSTSAIHPDAQQAFNAQGYGSFDEGVIPPFPGYSWFHPAIQGVEDTGHPNLDFEKGLEYWLSNQAKPTDYVELKKEANGNHYISLTPKTKYNGIITVKFPLNKLKPGDTPGLLYKWRGDQNAMQIILEQTISENSAEGIRIGHDGNRGNVNIWTADEDNEDEWNITLSRNLKPVQASTSNPPVIYYHVICESANSPELSMGLHIDDVQIVIHNDAEQKVYDLDGKLLYDLTNLPKREVVDYIFAEDLSEKDSRSKHNIDVNKLLKNREQLDKVTSDLADDDKDSSLGIWLWVIIAAAVILVLAAGAVVVFIVIKKKKATAAEGEETQPETEVQDKIEE